MEGVTKKTMKRGAKKDEGRIEGAKEIEGRDRKRRTVRQGT